MADENKEEFVENLTKILSHAENVGEETARKIALRTAKETRNLGTALKLIATDERFQEDLKDIGGVGATTVANVVDLAAEIVKGSLTIIVDTLDVLRVVSEDFLEARKDDVDKVSNMDGNVPDQDSEQNKTPKEL